jgi:spore photoproduct lyase
MTASLEKFLGQQDLCGNKAVAEIKVERSLFRNLKGERKERVKKVGDGSIICLFDKTPYPEKPTDVVCPHFLELKWANGCYFDCAWCYLNGTYRFHPEWKNGKPNIKDFGTIEKHISAFISANGFRTEIFNTGELSDSLLAENDTAPFSKFIVEAFDTHDAERKHKLLFLTKSPKVQNILELGRPDRIIMSFSLNAEEVARRWERAPIVEARIEAAKKVYDAGYTTRVRIDPMVPIDSWKKHYFELVDKIFSSFVPERITIGSLRGLRTTIANSKDKSWTTYLSESSNWGRKIDIEIRCEMYSELINYLKESYSFTEVALCKETVETWGKLGLDYKAIKCNCIW